MKKKIATVWLAGCSGCHMSLLDIDERMLDVAKLADIVKSPIVDGKELPNDVDITLVEGAVASDEHWHELLEIRKKSKFVVALGDCAVTGNVAALRNGIPVSEVIDRAYKNAASNVPGEAPNDERIQKLMPTVRPLHEIVRVDYYIPGCPPAADLIFDVLFALLSGRAPDPEKGRMKYG